MGISPTDTVNVNGVLLKKRRQKKQIQKFEKRLEEVEEEILGYKNDIQKKNRTIANLCDQLEKLGTKPDLKTIPSEHSSKNEDMLALCEENEALRKGLHEILESINKKRGISAHICTLRMN